MATTTIPWGDGSGDNIYLTYSSASGNQMVEVTSDANTGGIDRTKVVTFSASANGQTVTKTLTLIQEKVAEQYIAFADPVVEQICATKWGDGVGLKPSQAAHVTNSQFGTTFRNNTSIVSFDELQYFTGLTELRMYAFSGCSALTSIKFPSSVTSISVSSFEGCSGLTSIIIPPTITSLSTYSFKLCSGLKNVTINAQVSSINIGNVFGGSGDNSENSTLESFVASNTATDSSYFMNYIFHGDYTGNTRPVKASGYDLDKLIIDGNVLGSKSTAGMMWAATTPNFLEIGGTFSNSESTTNLIWYSPSNNSKNCIVHLSYNGVAGNPSYMIFNKHANMTVYVGDGSSAVHDNAILAQYMADTDWSVYSDRLDTWYNYIQGGGEYVTPPSMPTDNN